MGIVRITLRLYRMHDLDIITFVETHKLDFRKAMYCALKAFSKGEVFVIDIPPKREEGSELDLRRVYSLMMYLDTERDKEVIEMLSKIKEGCRNNFMKNLLRLYLCHPMSEVFLNHEEEDAYFAEKFMIFKQGKRITDAGSEVKIRKSNKKLIGGKNTTDIEDSKKDEALRHEHDKNNSEEKEMAEDNAMSIQKVQTFEQDAVNTDENDNMPDNDSDEDITAMFSSMID